MLRFNRTRIIGIFCLVLFVYFLVFSDSAAASDFRSRTEAGLSRKRTGILRGDLSDQELTDQTNKKLQKILAGEKHPENVDSRHEPAHYTGTKDRFTKGDPAKEKEYDTISIAGRKKIPKPKEDDSKIHDEDSSRYHYSADEKLLQNNADKVDEGTTSMDPARDIAYEKLQTYLKSPLVIFSKSYCPHSRRAKELLLEIYKISPVPVVVELDQLTEKLPLPPPKISHDDEHDSERSEPVTLGRKIQDILGEMTGRRTVPNIVIGGVHSIGGNDNIWELHSNSLLAEEIKKFGGRRIIDIDLAEEAHENKG